MNEIEKLLNENPEASAGIATREMHYGRLEWLAEHIERCNFQISPTVARKILGMLTGGEPGCLFELRAVRRSDIPPRATDPTLHLARNFDLALEVARKCGFKRGAMKQACFDAGAPLGLEPAYVAKCIRPFKQIALDALAEERTAEAYARDEVDFLGRPKHP